MLMQKQFVLLISFLIIAIGPVKGQNDSYSAIDSLLNSYVSGLAPGLAVGIVKNGETVYQRYMGYANLEHQVKIDARTRFNIASNAKQFTALSVLTLINNGQLSLEDDIRSYLPNFFTQYIEPITIAQLLTHTSGIRDVYDLWALKGKTWYELFIDNKDALALLQSQEGFNFEPGSAYGYSNSNYILLTALIQTVSGQSFKEYTSKMFEKLDMSDTAFLSNYMEVIPHKARPYGNWEGWKEYPSITEIHGDGALFTTLKDQLQWEMTLINNPDSAIASNILQQSQKPIPGTATATYGYGLMFDTYKGLNYIYHDGNTGAYNATFLRFPTKQTAIVVLSNNTNVPTHYLAKRIADHILDLENVASDYPAGPKTIPADQPLSRLEGNYRNKDGTIIKIYSQANRLYRKIYQRDPVELINENGSLYHYKTNKDLKMAFAKNSDGKMHLTLYLSSQPANMFTKLPSATLNKAYKENIGGTFYNKETNTTISITYIDDDLYTITKNGRERQAQLIIKDMLRMNGYSITIKRNQAGYIEGLFVKNGRIDRVWFTKQ